MRRKCDRNRVLLTLVTLYQQLFSIKETIVKKLLHYDESTSARFVDEEEGFWGDIFFSSLKEN
jgi:hypothetical protein